MNVNTCRNISFWIAVVVMAVAVLPIMPTFDAWTTTSAPKPFALDWHELLPQGDYWRPWDVLYGHLLGVFPCLFPYLNHIFIVLVHALNCRLTYLIAKQLGFGEKISYVAMMYALICPAMLGVMVDVDSIHQVAAMGWGLLSMHIFLRKPSKWWILLVLIGTLAKESCFAFMLITPFVAWGFGKISIRAFWRYIAWATMFGTVYLTARLLLTQEEVSAEYISITVAQLVKNHAIFVLFHIPIIALALCNVKLLRERSVLIMAACIIFASVLHLGSVYATMHTYVSLPFAAIIFAIMVDGMKYERVIYIIAVTLSILIDLALTKTTYDSGELGRRLAQEAIDKTPAPTDSVYTISVAAGPKGFSTFIVRDYNAFAWGIFSQHLNHYEWPTVLKDTTLYDYPTEAEIERITETGRAEGYKTFWVVQGDSIRMMQK